MALFDQPGAGRKQCPNCKKYVGGPRTKTCPGCQHNFGAKARAPAAPVATLGDATPGERSRESRHVLFAPAGRPPTELLSDDQESVVEWGTQCVEALSEFVPTVGALMCWVRYSFAPWDPEWPRIKRFLHGVPGVAEETTI